MKFLFYSKFIKFLLFIFQKVGGWRKQWFVLQNKLLLSYSSRDDYEKKLVPFKDAINLVPGTIIRPAAGSRFTIETTSNAIYMFVSLTLF